MAFSRVQYPGDGTNGPWTITFPFLQRAHVKVFIDGVEDTTFTFITDTTLNSTAAYPT